MSLYSHTMTIGYLSIARIQHQMSQKTYQRSKLFIKVNNIARIESLSSWIISLANAKSLFKINF